MGAGRFRTFFVFPRKTRGFLIIELSEKEVEWVGRFWTSCIFPLGARVQTVRKRGGVGGSILDFLRFFVRNAGLLNIELSEKRGSLWVDP